LSLEYFEGPAGSGKTFNLVESLKRVVVDCPLLECEAVLGVTYLHGSRRRMHKALAKIVTLKRRFYACTVDSLVRSVVCRWRSLGKEIDADLNVVSATPDFKRMCKVGAALLEKPLVGQWLAKRYPVVLVDELQDCQGDRLRVIKAIEAWTHMIAAADEFQDLSTTTGASEAVEWLHSTDGKRTVLTGNRRTRQQVLLRAADQLRAGCDCGDTLAYRLCAAKNANVGAGGAARGIAYNGVKDVVILTPAGPEASPFVSDVVARLTEKHIQPAGVKAPVGPFRIEWESTNERERDALLAKLGDLSAGADLSRLACLSTGTRDAAHELYEWAQIQHRLKGLRVFAEASLVAATDKILQSRRAFLPERPSTTIRAMTINQAKNREFDGVIVLWPFAVGGDLNSHRRKLYNAITRAKKWACVVVQECAVGGSRLEKPPFSKTPPEKSK
jgi:UvrD-like helicase C-terminal domain